MSYLAHLCLLLSGLGVLYAQTHELSTALATPVTNLGSFFLFCVFLLLSYTQKLKKQNENLRFEVGIDYLTGVHNRRESEMRYTQLLDLAKADQQILAVAVFDVDKFKVINDSAGHVAGDIVLRRLSHHVRHLIRQQDFFARLGGDEFVIIMRVDDAQDAFESLDRLRQTIYEQLFWQAPHGIQALSLSIGICYIDTANLLQYLTYAEALHHADTAMYMSKRAGGNRVTVLKSYARLVHHQNLNMTSPMA